MSTYAEIDIDRILDNPDNPRGDREHMGDLTELAASIEANGVIVSVEVFPVEGDQYMLESGHRRKYASLLAGLHTLPCVVVEPPTDSKQKYMRLLLSNLHRTDPNPIQEAETYRKILAAHEDMTQDDLARILGYRSQAAISNRLRLLELPEEVRRKIETGELSAGHGVALLKFKSIKDGKMLQSKWVGNDWCYQPAGSITESIVNMATTAVDYGWNVRKTESEADSAVSSQMRYRDLEQQRTERNAARQESMYQTGVSVRPGPGVPTLEDMEKARVRYQELRHDWEQKVVRKRSPIGNKALRAALEPDGQVTLDHVRLIAYRLLSAETSAVPSLGKHEDVVRLVDRAATIGEVLSILVQVVIYATDLNYDRKAIFDSTKMQHHMIEAFHVNDRIREALEAANLWEPPITPEMQAALDEIAHLQSLRDSAPHGTPIASSPEIEAGSEASG